MGQKKKIMQISIRVKILFFSIMLALIPLAVSSVSMITIVKDELKSSINDSLINTSGQIADEISEIFERSWQAPLMLIKSAMDNPHLDAEGKISLLENGIKNIEDFVSLQIYIEGFPPAILMKDDFRKRLENLGIDQFQILTILDENDPIMFDTPEFRTGYPVYVPSLDTWLVTILIPLDYKISGHFATLAAHIDAKYLKHTIQAASFTKIGNLYLIDYTGHSMLDPAKKDLNDYKMIKTALQMLKSGTRATSIQPFVGPEGKKLLGCYAIPSSLQCLVFATIDEADAYLSVDKMQKSLILWIALGLIAAAAGAILFSRQITLPILEIGKVVKKVGWGDFSVRVRPFRTQDEISTLGYRINKMIKSLLEHFHLQKFVSGQTMDAVRHAGGEGIKLGGERRFATVLFSDIRNFTAFSEKVAPETVIEMLNTYLRVQARVVREHNGDIDKYVGDELIAVFQGENMVKDAISCACSIQESIGLTNVEHPDWNISVGIGINTGEMVMGAMGSEERMDYTIIGDSVNLGARLCSNAKKDTILISEASFRMVENLDIFHFTKLEDIQVKGKSMPIQVYNVIKQACPVNDHESHS